VHVRVAEPIDCPRLTPRGLPRQGWLTMWVVAAMATAIVSIVACRRDRVATDVGVAWSVAAAPRISEATVADITLRDGRHQPVRGARLEVDAFMSHPAMAPVVVPVEERGDGVYRARVRFTMAGPWTVMVRGSLPDGRTTVQRVDIPDVRADAQ